MILLITVEETFRCTASSNAQQQHLQMLLTDDDAVHRNVSSTVINKIKITPFSVSTANSINNEGDISKVVRLTQKALTSLTVFETKNEMHMHIRLA